MAVLATYGSANQDADAVIGDIGGAEIRNAQGFQVSSDSVCTTAELYLKDGPSGSPTDNITVRIETDNAGVPSDTLVDASATTTITAADVTGTYGFLTATFPGSFNLLAGVQYHLVASVPSQAADVRFLWGRDNSSPGYTEGSASSSQDLAAWANYAADLVFIINGTVGIGGNLDLTSKSW